MWKCDRARNWIWYLPITRGMLCHMSYLGNFGWRNILSKFSINSVEISMIWRIFFSFFKFTICRMGWKGNMDNARKCLPGNHTKTAQMAEHSSCNEKISGSIPGSDTFSHSWFKNYSDFYSSFSDKYTFVHLNDSC